MTRKRLIKSKMIKKRKHFGECNGTDLLKTCDNFAMWARTLPYWCYMRCSTVVVSVMLLKWYTVTVYHVLNRNAVSVTKWQGELLTTIILSKTLYVCIVFAIVLGTSFNAMIKRTPSFIPRFARSSNYSFFLILKLNTVWKFVTPCSHNSTGNGKLWLYQYVTHCVFILT